MSKLAGKVAWVTGAGTGIGEATALALAGEGAEVIVTGRRREPLESVAKRIKEKGGKAQVQPADMMDAKAVGRSPTHQIHLRPARHPRGERGAECA